MGATAKFASGGSQHPDSAVAIGEAMGQVLDTLGGRSPSLTALFFSDHHLPYLRDIVDTLHEVLNPSTLIGASAQGVVSGATEIESGPSLALFALQDRDLLVEPVLLEAIDTGDEAAVLGWPKAVESPATLLLVADPFSFPTAVFLDHINARHPDLTVIGGIASAASAPGQNRLVLDRTISSEGAVGVLIAGLGLEIDAVVSQGCSPIGRPYIVTKAESNVLYELGGKPAIERLKESLAEAGENAKLAFKGLHIGIVVDENQESFSRGDFLIRNVIGADQETGAIAVGEKVEVGQTVQFQVRDAEGSHEDLVSLLSSRSADAALLFTCNGRGTAFFGTPSHDAGVVEEVLGQIPLAGFFCAGEIGPIGGKNLLHGFTASLALFRATGLASNSS
jgi:small ligand-binding sensory domain FIST